MRNNNPSADGTEGRLPTVAPLANPYVPFQIEDVPKYDPEKAFVRGTLFPGLDLPFMGMVNKTNKVSTPLSDLQTVAFVIQELALYLDTHRDDREAMEVYQAFQKMYAEAKCNYEMKYGPLTHNAGCENEYCWLNDPWPWEYSKNREA